MRAIVLVLINNSVQHAYLNNSNKVQKLGLWNKIMIY
jgi:hypothetical protein